MNIASDDDDDDELGSASEEPRDVIMEPLSTKDEHTDANHDYQSIKNNDFQRKGPKHQGPAVPNKGLSSLTKGLAE